MSDRYGMHVEFTAQSDRADELEAVLREAAEGTRADEDCLLYLVSRSPDRAWVVFVTEVWTSRGAHDAALDDPRVRELIERARPLMDGQPHTTPLLPRGGKGL
jgi:quinol monooxygenase YgiN